MATKVFLASPNTPAESVVEGVGAAVQSSFVVAVTIDLGNTVTDGSTTRAVKKSEAILALENIIIDIEKDPNGIFG